MANEINGLSGYGNYGVGGYMPRNNANVNSQQKEDAQPATVNAEATQIDPSKVMDFLSNNNYFIQAPSNVAPAGVDSAVQDRVAGYMEQFEMIYGIVLEEFGEELASAVMDVVMDSLIGMAE